MSNIDYSALINGEESIQDAEPAAPMMMTRSTERWYSRDHLTGHTDDNYSIIDEYKNIQINDKQINVTQENRGQYVPFEMARFYDNIDFKDGSITINYVRNGETKATREPAVNIQYTNDRLRFGWLLSKTATSIAGVLKFEVWVEGVGPDGQAYVWKSQPVLKGFEVIKGLGEGEYIELTDDWKQEIVDAFAEKIGESALANYVEKNELNGILTENNKPIYDYIDNHDIVSVEFTNDDNKYEYTLTLKRGDGTTYTNTINLPIESVVVNGSYIPETQTIVLTLKNGETISIPVSGLVSGLASETYVTEAIKTALLDYATKADIPTKVGELENDAAYATETYVEAKILEADISDKLTEYAKTAEVEARLGELGVNVDEDGNETPKTVQEFVEAAVDSVDVTEQLKDYATLQQLEEAEAKFGNLGEQTVEEYVNEAIDEVEAKFGELGEQTVEEYVNEAVSNVKVDLTGYATEEYVDKAVSNVKVDLTDYYTKDETYGKEAIDLKIGDILVDGNASSIADKLGDITIDGVERTVEDYVKAQTSASTKHNFYRLTYGINENNQDDASRLILWRGEQEKFVPHQQGIAIDQIIIKGGSDQPTNYRLSISYDEDPTLGILFNQYSFREEQVKNKEAIIHYSIEAKTESGQSMSSVGAKWEIAEQGINIYKVINEKDIILGASKFSFNVSEYLTSNKMYNLTLTITDKSSGRQASISWVISRIMFKLTINTPDTEPYNLTKLPGCSFTAEGKDLTKVVHFVFDQLAEETQTITSTSGKGTYTFPIDKILPTRKHGSHTLEIWMTALINGVEVPTEHQYLDYIFYNPTDPTPIIACPETNITTKQYIKTPIRYSVYRNGYLNHNIQISISDEVDSKNQSTTLFNNTYDFKSKVAKQVEITFTYLWEEGETKPVTKTVLVNCEALGYDINIAEGAVIDFDPVGRSNTDRVLQEDGTSIAWSDGKHSLITSSNFNWSAGGYTEELDKDGNAVPVFVIKAGTYAELKYEFFGEHNLKDTGADFKLIFKTARVEKENAEIVKCFSDLKEIAMDSQNRPILDENGQYQKTFDGPPIGFKMNVHEAYIYNGSKENYLHLPYSEEDMIEFGFQITSRNSSSKMVIGHEDGVMTSALVYEPESATFVQDQYDRQNIRLGSEYCDLIIYKLRIYEEELSNEEFLGNFIADGSSGEEIVARYERNQIPDGSELTPEYVAEHYPELRVITISTPSFTTGKNYPVGKDTDGNTTTIEYRYYGAKEGELSYWKCEDAAHVGQGTSSDLYGASGRNIDLVLKRHKDKKTGQYVNDAPLITTNDPNNEHPTKVALSKDSIPVNYFNIKVNVASSENANNALLAKRFNRYQLYKRPFIRENEEDIKKTKDTMEFFNCVVFIQEIGNGSHSEFNDNEVHFYAIGNIGDSKKTDNTRLTDQNDEYECCLEIKDVRLPLSDFPADTFTSAEYRTEKNGEWIYPFLNDDYKQYLRIKEGGNFREIEEGHEYKPDEHDYFIDGRAVEAFEGDQTYEWRYICETDDDTKNAEIMSACKNAWWALYDFIVYSTNEEFVNNFEKYFVLDSALYYYLFTERYTMVDNRAKNSFWHYGKTGETYKEDMDFKDKDGNILYSVKAGDPVRKWDLNWGYDFDTSLGIDNDGDLVYRYGLEDDMAIDDNGKVIYPEEVDNVFSVGTEIFRESDSTFFVRLRKLFPTALAAAYRAVETASADAWDDTHFIKEFDAWQAQFPEELWRLDIQRKYIRTNSGESIDNSIPVGIDSKYLDSMANGRKKYQRRQFERNQAKYMASKYHSSLAFGSSGSGNNYIALRCNDVSGKALLVPPNYDFTLTPYAYMYLTVRYGDIIQTVRVTDLNKTYTITKPIQFGDTVPEFINVESAHWISSLGDLSPKYLKKIDTSNAKKIKELIVGNDASETAQDVTVTYKNPSLEDLTINSNELLEKLDIQNVGYKKDLSLVGLTNIKEVQAFGSETSGFVSANGGDLQIARLPEVTSIALKNLYNLDTFELESYEALTKVDIENSNYDWAEFLNKSPRVTRLRLLGINWHLATDDLLARIYNMTNEEGVGHAQLTGYVELDSVKQMDLAKYRERWKELEIFVEDINIIHQYPVEFRNEDGTLVDTIYVVSGETATRTDKIPTKESTTQYTYEFAYWRLNDEEYLFTQPIIGPITLYAVYREHIRSYTINYWLNTKATAPLYTATGNYGDWISYVGEIPTDTSGVTAAGGTYRLFNRWSESGLVNDNKDIYAVFDEYEYNNEDLLKKSINELSRVELYAVSKKYPTSTKEFPNGPKYRQADSIKIPLGNDYDYNFNDIQTVVNLQGEGDAGDGIVTLEGNRAVRTQQNLFEGDKDFTLAVDFKREGIEQLNAVLFSCLNPDGGFEVTAKAKALTLTWKSGGVSTVFELESTDTPAREIMVIRHKAKSPQLDVFFSNTAKDKIFEESRKLSIPIGELSSIDAPLVLGARQFGDSYEGYAKETIYWTKVWNACLGDIECRSLAVWPHEQLEMMSLAIQDNDINVQTRARYTHVIGTKMNDSTFTFMSKYLLDKKTQMGSWNNTEVGWPGATEAINYLNNRLYFGINEKWRQLIKKTSVPYNARTGVATIENYIFLPSIHELDASVSNNEDVAWTFDIFTDNTDRVGTPVKGKAAGYWTRTVSQYGENYTNFYYIDEAGSRNTSWVDSYKHLRIMFTI